MNCVRHPNKWIRYSSYWVAALLLVPVLALPAAAQTWTWTTESVDASGLYSSLALDSSGNVHIAYVNEQEGIKYGFREARSGKWYSMFVDGLLGVTTGTTGIALDANQNPHICYTIGQLRYAEWDGKKWQIQQVNPGSGNISYTCTIAVAADGTPHLTWYQYGAPDGSLYLHIKHAALQNGVWLARTVDSERQTGKWQSIALDADGNPHVTFDGFISGTLKYGSWDGKQWNLHIVDSKTNKVGSISTLGMGNFLILNHDGKAGISYYDDNSLMYAWQLDSGWKIDTVSNITAFGSWIGYHSAQVLDAQGHPHIAYDDGGKLKHAWWDGQQWQIQTIVPGGIEQYRYSSIGIDKNQTIFISYRDPSDGSLKMAVGKMTPPSQTVSQALPKVHE
jgi:hypothetical protein